MTELHLPERARALFYTVVCVFTHPWHRIGMFRVSFSSTRAIWYCDRCHRRVAP